MRVTVFSTGGKFCPVSIFMQLHALTLVTRSYALLSEANSTFENKVANVIITILEIVRDFFQSFGKFYSEIRYEKVVKLSSHSSDLSKFITLKAMPHSVIHFIFVVKIFSYTENIQK